MSAKQQPNILFILLDEMRYPKHFPAGVTSADQFIQKFMPNTWRLLWSNGVRLRNYYTASSDCTPGRGTIVTGLYSQQTFCLTTRASTGNPQGTSSPQPPLQPQFPTYGKLLRDAGYDTPYIGKWHLSNFPASREAWVASSYLNDYGFQGLTIPDPPGLPGQGFGSTPGAMPPTGSTPPYGDPNIANQAVTWLKARASYGDKKPFCLTVGFVNPHDKQFFWGGIDASRYVGMYRAAGLQPPMGYTFDVVRQIYPPEYGYGLPENWQPADANQPGLHRVFRDVTNGLVGGISDDPDSTAFTMGSSPISDYSALAWAPFRYWTRALDMYTQAMSDVDVQIGQVVQNIPPSILENTVIVFSSDHGEYASSHGLQGKGMTVYDENMHLPFVFTDFTGRYAPSGGDRQQFGSSVDLLPLFGNIAFGDRSWMKLAPYAGMYERRNDLLAAITDDAPVRRPYALYSADEVLSVSQNYLHAPQHVLGYVDAGQKLGLYSYWRDDSATPVVEGQEVEYYRYTDEASRLELESKPDLAGELVPEMNRRLVPEEMQAPLPEAYQQAQQTALAAYWKFVKEADVSSIVDALVG